MDLKNLIGGFEEKVIVKIKRSSTQKSTVETFKIRLIGK
jgi:hypothetical protein